MDRSDINLQLIDLPCGIKAMVTANEDDSYTIFVNTRHSVEAQKIAALHELRHIRHGDLVRELIADQIEAMRREE